MAAGLFVNGGCSSKNVRERASLASGATTRGPGAGKRWKCRGGRIIEPLELLQDQVAVDAQRTDPEEVRLGVFDSRGDRTEVAGSELVFKIEDHLQPPLGRDVARPRRLELGRRKLAGDDGDGLRGIAGRRDR